MYSPVTLQRHLVLQQTDVLAVVCNTQQRESCSPTVQVCCQFPLERVITGYPITM